METTTKDIYRDTYLRYLGYANEVGESFRNLVPLRVVICSYVVASGYVLADACNKAYKCWMNPNEDGTRRDKKTLLVFGDALLWQYLASVIIPGYTINVWCRLNGFLLDRAEKIRLNSLGGRPLIRQIPRKQWLVTGLGLALIPFIIKPIDNGVDYIMDETFRKYISAGSI